jgi:hypothetical protein
MHVEGYRAGGRAGAVADPSGLLGVGAAAGVVGAGPAALEPAAARKPTFFDLVSNDEETLKVRATVLCCACCCASLCCCGKYAGVCGEGGGAWCSIKYE